MKSLSRLLGPVVSVIFLSFALASTAIAQQTAEIKITNQTSQRAEFYWVKPDGSEAKYGTLAPSQTKTQGSYSGHAWRAKDPNGVVLGNYIVPQGGGTWLIGATAAPAETAAAATTPPATGPKSTAPPAPGATGTATPPPTGPKSTAPPAPGAPGTATPPPTGPKSTAPPAPGAPGTATPPPTGPKSTAPPAPGATGTTTPPPAGPKSTAPPAPGATGTVTPPAGPKSTAPPTPGATSTAPTSTGTTAGPVSGESVAGLMRNYRALVLRQNGPDYEKRAQLESQKQQIAAQVKTLTGRTVKELEEPVVSAAFYHQGVAYLFHEGKMIAWDVKKKGIQAGYPKASKDGIGLEYRPDAILVHPDRSKIDIFYQAADQGYLAVFTLGDGLNLKMITSGETAKRYPGLRSSTPDAAVQLPSGVYLLKDSADMIGAPAGIPVPANYQQLDLTAMRAGEPKAISALLPNIIEIDASFTVPESNELYLFDGSFYWVYDYATRKYKIEGELIDETSWPRLAFNAAAAPVRLAETKLSDVAGVWDSNGVIMAFTILPDGGLVARYQSNLAQGIESLKGSQKDREARLREGWEAVTGTDPKDLTMKHENGTARLRFLNPTAYELTVPDGRGGTALYKFAKKSGAAEVAKEGTIRFDSASLALQGHPALRLPAGTVELSFKPQGASGPLFGAQGRFYMDYDQNGLVTFNGRIDTPVKTGEWHHLVVSSDGFVTRVALDGKEVGVLSEGIDMGTEQRIVFGARGNNYFQGEMKNVRIWDAAMPLNQLIPLKDQTLAGNQNLRKDLKPFLIAENGKLLSPADAWEKDIQNQTFYIVAHETIGVGERKHSRRGALTLAERTKNTAPYVAVDAAGFREQMFKLSPIGDGYYSLINVFSDQAVSVADAKQRYVYGTFVLIGDGGSSNVKVEVQGRHLAQAGPTKQPDGKMSQFRFLRQALLNDKNELELAWLVQSRASAETFSGTKSSFSSRGYIPVQDSYGREVVQLDKHELGGAFVHAKYETGQPKQQLFTFFPADPKQARPAPIKFADFNKRETVTELRQRQARYAGLSVAEKDAQLHYVAPVTNDPKGLRTKLLVAFNRYYGKTGGSNSSPDLDAGNFEQDYLRPLPLGDTANDGRDAKVLKTDDLRGRVESRFGAFSTQDETRKAFPEATQDDFKSVMDTLQDRLKNRSDLETLIVDYRLKNERASRENLQVRSELLKRLQVVPQQGVDIVRVQKVGDTFNVETLEEFVGLGGTGADVAGDNAEEIAGSFGVLALAVEVIKFERKMIAFSLSQLEKDETVTPYTDGSAELDKADRLLTKMFATSEAVREEMIRNLASLAHYDPTMIEPPSGKSQDKEKTWEKIYTDRKAELHAGMLKMMLPACGAIVGLNRKSIFSTPLTTHQTVSGGHEVDKIVNDFPTYANPSGQFGILDKKEALVAVTQSRLKDKDVVFTWHLVRRPASSKLGLFSPEMMKDVQESIPDARELMRVMSDSIYVHGMHYRKANPVDPKKMTAIPGAGNQWERAAADLVALETMDDAPAGQGDGEGIWMPVPQGKIGDKFTVQGSFFTGKNTGRDGLEKHEFVHPESVLTLFYWPPKQINKDTGIWQGAVMPLAPGETPKPTP